MYEAKAEPHEFIGRDRDDAVGKACEFFGCAADALRIRELEGDAVSGLAGRVLVVAAPAGVQPGRSRRGGPGGRRSASSAASSADARDSRRRGSGEEEPSGPSEGTALGTLSAVGQFVLGVIERMDLGPFEIGESEEGEFLICQLRGPAIRRIATGEGRAMDALQLLANQTAARHPDDAPRVVLDGEGDAEQREELLERLAQRAARRATDSRRAIAMDAMNARDRRIIHLALRDDAHVATMSVGAGRYRQVVVVPEGAPEYDEARQQSDAAASRGADA